MENEFLQKVNLYQLQKETGKTLQELAAIVGIGEKVIYKWAYDKQKFGSRPSYNAVILLLQLGASVESIFGIDYSPNPGDLNSIPQDLIDDRIRSILESYNLIPKGR